MLAIPAVDVVAGDVTIEHPDNERGCYHAPVDIVAEQDERINPMR